ncbi:MAG: hypothetical protein WA787_01400, partial [Azonexus sp.]
AAIDEVARDKLQTANVRFLFIFSPRFGMGIVLPARREDRHTVTNCCLKQSAATAFWKKGERLLLAGSGRGRVPPVHRGPQTT